MKDKLSTERMIELEKYLHGEVVIEEFDELDLKYLEDAKRMPIVKMIKYIVFYNQNKGIDVADFICSIEKELNVTKYELIVRFDDVNAIRKYNNKNNKNGKHLVK